MAAASLARDEKELRLSGGETPPYPFLQAEATLGFKLRPLLAELLVRGGV